MRTGAGLAAGLAIGCALLAGGARADVVPGDKITDQNMEKVKDLISPGMEWCIKRGFPMTIVEPKRIEWPKAYKEATEKYSAQVKLAPDGLSVQNFIAGQPFPDLDPKDPQIALKIMWDYEYKFNPTDDLDLRNFDADTGAVADHGPMSIERHFLLDHLRSQFWTGRLYVDPKPEKPNPNGYRSQLGLYPVLEPFDLKGVGAVGQRVIFIDKEAWVVPYSDIYDRSGELWKIWINDWSFKKKAFDGAGVIEYPDEIGFQPSIVMVDMQLEHATKAALPSHRFPGEQGWYFNQGEKAGISDEFFTVAALVNAGH